MKKFHVSVAVRILEIYEVEAGDAEDWSFGRLIHTNDEALYSEVLSVRTVTP